MGLKLIPDSLLTFSPQKFPFEKVVYKLYFKFLNNKSKQVGQINKAGIVEKTFS